MNAVRNLPPRLIGVRPSPPDNPVRTPVLERPTPTPQPATPDNLETIAKIVPPVIRAPADSPFSAVGVIGTAVVPRPSPIENLVDFVAPRTTANPGFPTPTGIPRGQDIGRLVPDPILRPNPGFPTPTGISDDNRVPNIVPGTRINVPNNPGPNGPDSTQKPDPVTQALLDALVGAGNASGVLGSVSPQPTVVMNPNASANKSSSFLPIIIIAVLAGGGYFLYQRYTRGGK